MGDGACDGMCIYKVDLTVYMVKVSAEQKPYRKVLMETFGGKVVPSPSETTAAGRKILAENPPGFGGSLGCAISEALETAMRTENCRYVLGSVLDIIVSHDRLSVWRPKRRLINFSIGPISSLAAPAALSTCDRFDRAVYGGTS